MKQSTHWNGTGLGCTVGQTSLDPSLEKTLSHRLAREHLKGIPSYIEQPDVIKAIRDNQLKLDRSVRKMILHEGSCHTGKFTGPGVQNNRLVSSKEDIAQASKEYALSTIL